MLAQFLAAGLLTAAVGGEPGPVFGGYPGPYEVHYYPHRTNSFDQVPFFATNPPVYYSDQRFARSYGWTPYAYQGIQYQKPLAPWPHSEPEKPAPVPKKQKKPTKASPAAQSTLTAGVR